MKLQQDDAYVLKTQPLGDADLIVTLLAAQHGKVRGVARSARRSRKRFGGVLEPMTRVRAGWAEKAGRELHRIDSVEGARSFATMQADPALQCACAILGELAEGFAHEGESDRKTFDLLGAVLDAFESGLAPWTGVRYFEYWLLRLHGLLPDTSRCAGCTRPIGDVNAMRVEVAVGAWCADCADGEAQSGQGVRLGRAELAFLHAARTTRPVDMPEYADAVRPGGALDALLRTSLEHFIERPLRAYRHLRAHTKERS